MGALNRQRAHNGGRRMRNIVTEVVACDILFTETFANYVSDEEIDEYAKAITLDYLDKHPYVLDKIKRKNKDINVEWYQINNPKEFKQIERLAAMNQRG